MTAYPDLWVLRHGQTEWNAAGRMQGRLDSPLTRLGLAQACEQNCILKAQDLPPDTRYFASPAGRTQATAKLALSGLCDAPTLDDRLLEVSVGEFEGMTLLDLEEGWPGIMNSPSQYPWHYRAPGGETYDVFRARIKTWLDELIGPTVVVTHGMVSGVMRGLALGLDLGDIARLPGGQGLVYHVSGPRLWRLTTDAREEISI